MKRSLAGAFFERLGWYDRIKKVQDVLSLSHDLEPEYFKRRQQKLSFYSQFIRPGDLCFDIGANFGDRVEIFLLLGGTVVAVEPHPMCMRALRIAHGGDSRVMLVEKGAADRAGEAEIQICETHSNLTSMSKEWVSAVTKTERFPGQRWGKPRRVPTTTLDALVKEFGFPAFCKVDVEGFEEQVIRGLTVPSVRAISFEFTPEFISSAVASVRHLSKIAPCELNYSPGESMVFALSEWVSGERMSEILETAVAKKPDAGDVYARFLGGRS